MKWIYDEDIGYWICSKCDSSLETFDDPDYNPYEFGYRFCPYCGAEAEDEDEAGACEVPYVAIDPGEEETFMLRDTCPACGAEFEFSFAELLWCSKDDDRPRPKCPKCGRSAEIGHAKRWDEEKGWVEV